MLSKTPIAAKILADFFIVVPPPGVTRLNLAASSRIQLFKRENRRKGATIAAHAEFPARDKPSNLHGGGCCNCYAGEFKPQKIRLTNRIKALCPGA
jgi:hypothetical protein